jgi:hypothetical protein
MKKPTYKQLQACYLVKELKETPTEAGRIMGGISPQAINRLLARLSKNRQPPRNKNKINLSL